MKKQLVFGVLAVLAKTAAIAQLPMVLQPDHVTIQRLGERPREAYFEYDENGILQRFTEVVDCATGSVHYDFSYDEDLRLAECEVFKCENYNSLYQFEYHDGVMSQNLEWFHDDRFIHYYWEPRYRWIPIFDDEKRFVGDTLYYWNYLHWELRWTTTITLEPSMEIAVKSEYSTQKRMTKTLDPTGRTVSLLTELLNNGSYTNSTLDEYYYTNGVLCRVETKKWENQEWVNDKEVVYSRDSFGRISMTTYCSWNGTEYIGGRRTLYERNSEGYPTSLVFQSHTSDGWTAGSNPIWVNGAGLHSAFRDTLFNNYKHLAIQQQVLGAGRAGITRMDITYIPTPYPTYSARDEVDSPISCVPNPTSGSFTIVGKNLQLAVVYDIKGQCVARCDIKGNSMSFDLSKQAPGLYFVSLLDDNGKQHVKKVVKQ